jgi:hypothetical protein
MQIGLDILFHCANSRYIAGFGLGMSASEPRTDMYVSKDKQSQVGQERSITQVRFCEGNFAM